MNYFRKQFKKRFVDEATEEYITELKNRKLKVDYSESYNNSSNSSVYGSFRNNSVYYSCVDDGLGGLGENSSHCDGCAYSTFGSFYDSVPRSELSGYSSAYNTATDYESSESSTVYYDASNVAKAVDAYMERYMKEY